MKKLSILIPSFVATASMPLIGLVGCINQDEPKNPEPEAKSFESDPWETVCYYANLGLDRLCQVYNAKPKDLLGKTRDITINSQTHKVKVIGTNEDVYLVDDASYFSALTFQFDTLITDQDGQVITCQWNQTDDSEHYWSSSIHKTLNDETSQDITSIYEMLIASNPWATQYLRSTCHWVNTKEGSNWKINVGTEKLFLPVLSDLFSVSGLEATDSAIIGEGNVAQYYYENVRGSQYSYFNSSKNIGNNPIATVETTNSSYKSFSCLKKEHDYWLCSPYLLGSTYAWYVTANGCVKYSDSLEMVSTPMALAPCFCI